MVIGYFDPAQIRPEQRPVPVQDIVLNRRLNSDTVTQLQLACDEILGVQLRLADYFLELGLLVIERGSITQDMFRVACAAHELFSMTAVDTAHREMVYPRPDREPSQEEKNFVQAMMDALPKASLESYLQSEVRRKEFENEVIQRVRAVRDQRRVEQTTPPTS
jgi:hypothetical protein